MNRSLIDVEKRHLLLPAGMVVLGLVLLLVIQAEYARSGYLVLVLLVLMLSVAATAVQPFGVELPDHLARLLSQPISRKRLWWTKSLMAGLVLLPVAVVLWLAASMIQPNQVSHGYLRAVAYYCIACWAIAPVVLLYARQAFAATLATFLHALMLPLFVRAGQSIFAYLRAGGQMRFSEVSLTNTTLWFTVGLMLIAFYFAGYRKFMRMEV